VTVTRPAIFLDRDGVINELVNRDGGRYSPRRLEDFKLFPWTLKAVNLLKNADFLIIVITNQPDISRGNMTHEALNEMHTELLRLAPIDAIYTCPHDARDNCNCRKPKPGMFLNASRDLNIDLSSSWTVGDRESDLIAGNIVGTRLIQVVNGQDQDTALEWVTPAQSLLFAAYEIISSKIPSR
jgi:D-glycero-D-manno-heptose 1,7-bisphosphate phosphatase